MSQWTHPICDECYASLYPGRVPYLVVEPVAERCCVCADPTTDGIYFREDPNLIPAHENHDD